jgi:CheY-like chemotaxis protein
VAPDAEGRFLDFSVEDTGIGISSETIGLLFKPFTQADMTTTRAFGGTGLGLVISKRLAEAMDGSITVASIPGKGSTFTFHFPLAPPTGGTGVPPVWAQNIAAENSAAHGRDAHAPCPDLVLVVEDDPENSTLAGKMLRSLGYRAEFAVDGAEAIRSFVPGKYFAILMDIVMPVMGGSEATRKIREIEVATGGHVPIIALTANVMPGDRERCLAAGMDDFLSKPFKRAELSRSLEKRVK